MVRYKDKRINKYYPGLSLLWTPFFAIAHASAKLLGYKADGYSFPYQIAIAIASLCYLFLGLFYLRKLLQKIFNNQLVALIIPIVLLYGTHLFYYGIFLNSQSHVFSFALISAFMYFVYSFGNENEKKHSKLLCALLCFIILISIRPLNGLIIFIIPAFVTANFSIIKVKIKFLKTYWLIIALILLTICNTFTILYTQTGTIIPYTYVNERFYFNAPKLYEVLFSYHAGLFIYVPLAFLSCIGMFYLKNNIQKILFPSILLIVLYMYSSWWYWPITTRAFIDFYPIMAIMLAAVMHKAIQYKCMKPAFIMLVFLLTGYHQLKSFQLHNGILDENYTHSQLFWKNFFQIKKSNQYVIPPSSIINEASYREDFETNSYIGYKTDHIFHQGIHAALLNNEFPFSGVFTYKIPNFFSETGVKKIRFSGWYYFSNDINNAQVYFKFFNQKDSLLLEVPFYIGNDLIQHDSWDYKEFGYELSDDDLKSKAIDHFQVFVWNNEKKGELYIDDIKTEFILTDKSFEIVQ